MIFNEFVKNPRFTNTGVKGYMCNIYIDGLVQDYSIPSALAMDILQDCSMSIANALICLLTEEYCGIYLYLYLTGVMEWATVTPHSVGNSLLISLVDYLVIVIIYNSWHTW